jgi:hypothetical protein
MKTATALLALALGLASAAFGAEVNLDRPIPELKLRDGRTLRNVAVMSYAPTAVMAKWEGGRGTLTYDVLPDGVREAAGQRRPAASAAPVKSPPVTAKASPAPTKTVVEQVIAGTVYITTQGAGVRRFADATVAAYPLSYLSLVQAEIRQAMRVEETASNIHVTKRVGAAFSAWSDTRKKIGMQPVAATATDANGDYELRVPAGETVFIVCYTTRQVGRTLEENFWMLPASAGRLDLNGSNETHF